MQPSSQPPPLQPHVSTTKVGPHPSLFAAAPKRSASTIAGNPHLPSVPKPVLVVDHSQSPCTMKTVISCIIPSVSQCFSGTQAHHAGTPPRLTQRLVDGFMGSSNEASDHVPHVSHQFIGYGRLWPIHFWPANFCQSIILQDQ